MVGKLFNVSTYGVAIKQNLRPLNGRYTVANLKMSIHLTLYYTNRTTFRPISQVVNFCLIISLNILYVQE